MSDRRTELFAMRCRDLRDRVAAGRLGFIDAIARPRSSSDLVDDLGDDVVQQVMAVAFGDAPRAGIEPAQDEQHQHMIDGLQVCSDTEQHLKAWRERHELV